jgi:hypothetical protein
MSNQTRQPTGAPASTGGRFATSGHTETGTELAAPDDAARADALRAAVRHLGAASDALTAYRESAALIPGATPRSPLVDLEVWEALQDEDLPLIGTPAEAMTALLLAGERPGAAVPGYEELNDELGKALDRTGQIVAACASCGERSLDENACANCTRSDEHGRRVGECTDCCGCYDGDTWEDADGVPAAPPIPVLARLVLTSLEDDVARR